MGVGSLLCTGDNYPGERAMKKNPDYAKRASEEATFFKRQVGKFNTMPPMLDWLSDTYVKPRVKEIFETDGPIEFYARPVLKKMAGQPGPVIIASIGSGDGEVELGLGRYLSARGSNFLIEGYELSEDLVQASRTRCSDLGLDEKVRFICEDFNGWKFEKPFDFCIANQVLHHAVELEALFEQIRNGLANDGILMVRDMIGKNGHQAWPEAKAFVDAIWQTMPRRYQYNHRSEREFSSFPNTDFSTEGFEGIRSQDIMPLLVENFHFSHFYSFGGIVERFVNRGFGHSYEMGRSEDVDFCIGLQMLNDFLIDAEMITPTQIIAYLGKQEVAGPRFWKSRAPAKAIRVPDDSDL